MAIGWLGGSKAAWCSTLLLLFRITSSAPPRDGGKFSAIAKIFLKALTSYFSSFILTLRQHHIHHLRVYHEPCCLPIAFVWTPLQYPKSIQPRQLPSCFFSSHNILLASSTITILTILATITFLSCYPQLNNIRNQLGTL